MKRFKEYIIEDVNQTNTPAFKKWFGKSKVVDKNGKPLVVYHGSNKSFNTFSSKPDGTYFTTDLNHDFIKGTNYTIPVYITIKKPYYALNRYEVESAIYSGDWNNNKSFAKELNKKGYDGIIYKGGKDTQYEGINSPQYVVFKPNQIKSATNNNGEFSTKNDNINK